MRSKTEASRPRVIILQGPTGVGKSRLALSLSEEWGGDIISADSMQVYRYMDIGTAKPTVEERKRVTHHLIDIVDPDQPFHAALYRTLGRKAIDRLHREGRPIWVVGGTGLYIKSLTQGLFSSPAIDPSVRERLKQEAEEFGEEALFERLKEVDPKTAALLHPRDLFRTIRALEVFESTGVPISFLREQHRFGDRPYITLSIGLEMDRAELYDRIEARVEGMIDRGLIEEVRGLMERGYGPELKPMQSLGYKQMAQFLLKKIGWEEGVRQMKTATRHYAKRQWTWFKSDPEIEWINVLTGEKKVRQRVKSFLQGGR